MTDEEEYDLFCTHCGQRITKDTVFCPSCGTQVSDMGGEPTYGNGSNNNDRGPTAEALDSRLKFLAILMVITAVYYVLSAISNLLTIDATIDLYKDLGMWDQIVDSFNQMFGMNEQETEDFIRTMTIVTSIMSLVMGALIGVGSYCSFSKKKWKLGLICLIIATVLASSSIFGLVIGVIVTYLYSTTKPCFQA